MRITEKEDVPLLVRWSNDVGFACGFQHFEERISNACGFLAKE